VKTSNLTWLYLFIYGAGVEPSPLLLRPLAGLLCQPWMTDGDVCGAISGMYEWQGKPKYSEVTATVPLCPRQIPNNLTWTRAQAAAVGSLRLTA
jgi:hypothetical protein